VRRATPPERSPSGAETRRPSPAIAAQIIDFGHARLVGADEPVDPFVAAFAAGEVVSWNPAFA
jgi:hypothetical protein